MFAERRPSRSLFDSGECAKGAQILLALANQGLAKIARLSGPIGEKAIAGNFLLVYPTDSESLTDFEKTMAWAREGVASLLKECQTEKGPLRLCPLLFSYSGDVNSLYWSILALGLPANLPGLRDNVLARSLDEKSLTASRVPSVLLALSQNESNELIADLFCLPGISFETGLAELKKATRLELALNALRN